MSRFVLASTAVVLQLLVGCSTLQEGRCGPAERHSVSELLYFGRAKPTGVVSPEEWSNFLGSTVTPRFPAGLTAWQASGQWQSADGKLSREDSYVLSLIHPVSLQAEADIQSIVSEYKARFQQEAVLRVKANACTTF